MATEVRRSTCNRDCPDACALVAEVEGGEVLSLRGDPAHPVTRGFLCYRTSHFPAQQRAPHRLTTALVRRNGKMVGISVDEALDIAAERLIAIRAESGPAAVFHYRSGGSLGMLKGVADRFFELFGPCTAKSGDVCSGAGDAAQITDFGVNDSNDLLDLRHSRHIVLWGKNPTISSVHLVPLLRECRRRGATITLVDPVRHKTAAFCDTVLQPRPGGDVELALGVLRALLDRGAWDPAVDGAEGVADFRRLVAARPVAELARLADVSPGEIEQLADLFADGPTAILVGWGMQRRRRGAQIVRALDALSFASGNLFRSGGGCSFYFRRRHPFVPFDTGAAARHVREPCFGADVLAADPPIRAMWITAGNPVCMLPDSARVAEAIDRTEFVVVVDPFLTDTGRRADLVIPVPTLLEDSDLVGAYGHHWIGESRPLVEPPPGVRHEVELFCGLARRVGLGDRLAGEVDDFKRQALRKAAEQGVTLERLREGSVRSPFAGELLFPDGRVHTPSGAVRLLGAVEPPLPDDAALPLWLFSNSTEKSQAAQWVHPPAALPITVHPAAAAAVGLADGDDVVVESELGAIAGVLRVDAGQRRDVALVPKGGHFDRGQSANALIAAVPTDQGLGAAYLDTRVRIRRP